MEGTYQSSYSFCSKTSGPQNLGLHFTPQKDLSRPGKVDQESSSPEADDIIDKDSFPRVTDQDFFAIKN